ncbi:MAG: class I SAM-dependent methyltransferase [Eubacteriales bacterium]|nr:class I SAM-dependent methyltransferase [Eubacteriales bacterium]
MDIVLSKRMETVVNMVLPQSVIIGENTQITVADIGCDHAYVSIALIKRGIAKNVIAMDVRKGPLAIAKKNVQLHELEDVIDIRLSDGLEKLACDEADVVVIAGMGGLLVKGILERGNHITPRPILILQPQSDLKEVRKYLLKQKYIIEKEEMLIDEGKYYTVMRVIPEEHDIWKQNMECDGTSNDATYSEVELLYGRYGLQHKDMILSAYLKKEAEQLQQIRQKLQEHVDDMTKKGMDIPDKTKERICTIQQEIEYNNRAREYFIQE